jgi:hypothetical protein
MSHLTKALRSSCVSLPLLITLLSSLVLISCGGGGGGSSGGGGNTDTSLTGSFYFVQNNSNLAIANVPYTLSRATNNTSSTPLTGKTANNGSFSYEAGDTVVFNLAGTTLPSMTASSAVTSVNIATALCSTAADSSACQYLANQNLTVALLSLDSDQNAANGIQVRSDINNLNLNFNSSIDQFAASLASQLSPYGVSVAATFKPSLGMNTEAAQAERDDVIQSIPFVDIFRIARPFKELSACASYDAHGWPTSAPSSSCTIRTVFLKDYSSNQLPEGQYTVIYEGSGTLTYGNYASLVSRSPGLDIINLSFAQTDPNRRRFDLNITANDVNNPIKNIRIVMPGGICTGNPFVRVNNANECAADKPFISFADTLRNDRNAIVFNPDYLNFMKDFRVIRMMNLQEASPSANKVKTACANADSNLYNQCFLQDFNWDQRAKMDDAVWGASANIGILQRYGRGVPLEVLVELANQLNAHPWFNILHNATDDYVSQFASYVRDHLKPNLKAHIEYSNETWNEIFWGALYVREKGKGLFNPTTINPYWDGAYYYAKRSTEIFKIFEDSFAGTNRLVRLLATKQNAPELTQNMLNYNNTKNSVDAIATGGYFYGCWSRSTSSLCQDAAKVPKVINEATSVDDLFSIMDNANDPYGVASLMTQFKNQKTVADRFAKALYVYEGGQHLVIDWNDASLDSTRKNNLLDLIRAANKDPRMGERYTTLLNGWKAAGGQQFMLYTQPQSYHPFGAFGIKQALKEPRSSAPKYDAAMKFQETQGNCWWSNCTN